MVVNSANSTRVTAERIPISKNVTGPSYTNQKKFAIEPRAISPREAAQELSKANLNPEIDVKGVKEINSVKNNPWLNIVTNFLKNSSSLVLNGLGLVGSSLAFLSYFVFNFKAGSLIFALPSAMSFFIAYQFKHSIHDSGSSATLDPIKGLEKIIYEKGLNQDTDRTLLLNYIYEASKLVHSETQAEDALKVLQTIKEMVDSRIYELQTVESFDQDKNMIQFKNDLQRYKEALEDLNLEEIV